MQPTPGAATSTVTVSLCSNQQPPCNALQDPSSIQIDGAPLDFFVQVSFTASPAPTQTGVVTSLGNFGTDAAGNPITSLTLGLIGGGSSRYSERVQLFAGDTAGRANLAANVGSATSAVTVDIREPDALFLTSIDPTVGHPDGGDCLTINGRGFREPLRVTIGSVTATDSCPRNSRQFLSATRIQVETPRSKDPVGTGETSTVDVTVTLPASGSLAAMEDTLQNAFTYSLSGSDDLPSITSVVPAQYQNSGLPSRRMVITGRNFDSDAIVLFGMGSSASSFSGTQVETDSVTATRIELTIPAATPTLRNRTIDIQVRNPSTGLAAIAGSAFTYVAEDMVVDIDPREGSYRGSTACTDLSNPSTAECVKVTASGLPTDGPMLAMEFGGVSQGSCTTTGSTCRIFPPAAGGSQTTIWVKARAVDVTGCTPPAGAVTITDQQTGETSSGPTYTYTAERPIVAGASPSSGPEGGLAGVEIQGTFSTVENPIVVRFGGVQATVRSTLPLTDPTGITVDAPPFTGTFNQVACGTNGLQQVPTAVDVEVLYPTSGCSSVATGAFTYEPATSQCVEDAPPVANYSFTVDNATLTVSFMDTSSGDPTAWLWDFGDGATSALQNPSHTYAAAGVYSVTLQASNAGGTGSVTKQITVGTAPVADFTFNVGAAVSPPPPCASSLYVQFTDRSTGNPTSWLWSFGDGSNSAEQHPAHCYPSAGTRTVTLTATNAVGSNSVSKTVTVN